jgi:hypothetical protein
MAENESPKSALDLAMERFRRKDAEDGVVHVPLTDVQKAEIAEVRNFYEARLAEMEVLHRSSMRGMADPAARAELEANYRREREHIASERDAKLARLRGERQ